MAKRFYTIFCDESEKKGKFYSNFYGGALAKTEDVQSISNLLNEKKEELNLNRELKWTRITFNYADKYISFIDEYFNLIATNRLKIRIMFTQNYNVADGLTSEQRDQEYFLLYYQLIKHHFGLKHSNPQALDRIFVSVMLDQLPDTKEKCDAFRQRIANLSHTLTYQGTGTQFPYDQIASIDSRKHVILQGLDIILGSMFFRLNDLHKVIPDGANKRGKRTIAKERVYKHINSRIRAIRPRFNIGISTGTDNGNRDRWLHPYRHWLFKPNNSHTDPGRTKKNK